MEAKGLALVHDDSQPGVAEDISSTKKKISKYEELALAANRAGDDAKCKQYQQKIQVLKQKMSQGVAEGYTGRETKDGTWRVFKDGQAVAVAGPFKSRDEAHAWIKNHHVVVAKVTKEEIEDVTEAKDDTYKYIDQSGGHQIKGKSGTYVGYTHSATKGKGANILKHNQTKKYYAAGGSSTAFTAKTNLHDTPQAAARAYHKGNLAEQDEKETQEYDYEGDMARSDLRSIINNAQEVHDMLEANTNLPEWVQSKITLAEDYVATVRNYMKSENMAEANVWDKPSPNKPGTNKMTPDQRAEAKKRAKAAGRPYPNLVDNMAAMK